MGSIFRTAYEFVLADFLDAPRPRLVKLILSAQDVERPIVLTMYNVMRTGIAAAEDILSKGKSVRIEYGNPGSAFKSRTLSDFGDLERWRGLINTIEIAFPSPQAEADPYSASIPRAGSF
ncbi:MAG: hypothetical protein JWP91_1020 [Fibrobacteres bacterium]|nr:hypothetical protein [Fibrobacterota bacterium]